MTTCQICARPIKVRHGRIVQHGYQVPWGTAGDHSRTTSCLGYGYPPYEEGRDRIREVVAIYEGQHAATKKLLEELIASPPERLARLRRDYHGRMVTYEATRPEGFDPERLPPMVLRSYADLFVSRRNHLQQSVNMIAVAIGGLEERYKAWVEPAEPETQGELA